MHAVSVIDHCCVLCFVKLTRDSLFLRLATKYNSQSSLWYNHTFPGTFFLKHETSKSIIMCNALQQEHLRFYCILNVAADIYEYHFTNISVHQPCSSELCFGLDNAIIINVNKMRFRTSDQIHSKLHDSLH